MGNDFACDGGFFDLGCEEEGVSAHGEDDAGVAFGEEVDEGDGIVVESWCFGASTTSVCEAEAYELSGIFGVEGGECVGHVDALLEVGRGFEDSSPL